jgi:hypothetical protein
VLLIPVDDGAMEKVKELLDRLGFQHQTGPDSFPEERPMRTGSWVHDIQDEIGANENACGCPTRPHCQCQGRLPPPIEKKLHAVSSFATLVPPA